MADRRDAPPLPCPECRMRGVGGMARIGNRRNVCTVCNRFAQSARRLAYQKFLNQFPEEYAALRLSIELALYPNVLEQFLNSHPAARETLGTAQEETPDATPRTK